jgi:hypothetical protein
MNRIAPIATSLVVAACGDSAPRVAQVEPIDLPPEVCDGTDNDEDGEVDEGFRAPSGAYLHAEHCGACRNACATSAGALSVDCAMTDAGPRCVATSCNAGYILARSGQCVRWARWLCRPCLVDSDCGDFEGAVCADLTGERRCAVACVEKDCPSDYVCDGRDDLCRPPRGDCQCRDGVSFDVACEIPINDETNCLGVARCEGGSLSECRADVEVCDGIDNDCNGVVDDPFVDARGFYTVDVEHCGGCGIDCTLNPLPAHDLTCGGPVTSPRCAMLCADTEDGVDVGDRVDADLELANGCECQVRSLDDPPGPPQAPDGALDPNCDGADGIVADSLYVALGGNDSAPGSPLAPKASISAAVEAAAASLDTAAPRPHVFVAAGSYAELLVMREGVMVHGGYSPDFRHRDPAAFVTEIHPPSYEAAPGGAALLAENVGRDRPTSIDGVWLRGAAAPAEPQAAFGAYLAGCGSMLTISDAIVEAGDGADGSNGTNGVPALDSAGRGADGEAPRASEENTEHVCVDGATNLVAGGTGEPRTCGDDDVSGGDGGSAACPGSGAPSTTQIAGRPGRGPSGTPGGAGGAGGWDSAGPMYAGNGCPAAVCCGLADFLVSSDYAGATDGAPGRRGESGAGGAGCADSIGSLVAGTWSPAAANPGSDGLPGSGGGGGGAGGSALIRWEPDACEYPDGLGGGGAGGGAGGCGGRAGEAGNTGSPSIALVVAPGPTGELPSGAPVLVGVTFRTGHAGTGGTGGTGGPGGLGGSGGAGGELEPQDRTVPPLSGSSFGGHGGAGGAGGSGGGGGGGCGGSSIGVWLNVPPQTYPGAAASYAAANSFEHGSRGAGGEGGAGGGLGGTGLAGEVQDVVER